MQNSMISSAAAIALANLLLVARVEKNDRMQIAVARVKDIADLEAVFFSDFVDAAQRGRKFCSRNHAVLHVIGGREPADGAEGIFAALPQQIAFVRVASHADFARVVHAANVGDFFRLRLRGFAQSIHIDQQDGRAIERKSGVNVIFDGAKRPAVEHFARRGRDAARGDFDHRFGGVVDSVENREQRLHSFGQSA